MRALSDSRDWRRLLRPVPAGLPGEADDLARGEAGKDGQGRLLTTARVLARGALTARALGEETVAEMFEAGLSLYGQRAEMARAQGRMDELLPERPERGQRGEAPTQDLPDPKDRPETPEQRRQRRQREWAQNRPRRRRRGLLRDLMGWGNASDDQVARMALEVWGIEADIRFSDRPRRRARTMAYAWEVEALRKQQAAAQEQKTQDREQAELDPDPSPQAPAQLLTVPDYAGMARDLSGLIAAQNPAANTVQPAGLETQLAALLERADTHRSGPWSKPGAASLEQLAARISSLPGLDGADRALADVIGQALAGDETAETVPPIPKDPDAKAKEAGALRATDSDITTGTAGAHTQDGAPKGRSDPRPAQLSFDLTPGPSGADATPTPAAQDRDGAQADIGVPERPDAGADRKESGRAVVRPVTPDVAVPVHPPAAAQPPVPKAGDAQDRGATQADAGKTPAVQDRDRADPKAVVPEGPDAGAVAPEVTPMQEPPPLADEVRAKIDAGSQASGRG